MIKYIYSTALFLLLGVVTTSIYAQVTIAPTNLFIKDNARFGTYMVVNGSSQTQEVSVDFLFAFSKTDEEGNRRLASDNPTIESQHSIAPYIRAFPRNFTLAPGQRQVVRLRLNVPTDLADGTYWARIKTSSSPETPPLELQNNDAVAARVGITIEQNTGVFYKKGNVTTGIDISQIRTELNPDNNMLTVFTDLTRTGNSPFLGSITTSMIDSGGREVKQAFVSTSLYFDTAHKSELEISDLPAGQYSITVKFESQRGDISREDMIPMETVFETTTYVIR